MDNPNETNNIPTTIAMETVSINELGDATTTINGDTAANSLDTMRYKEPKIKHKSSAGWSRFFSQMGRPLHCIANNIFGRVRAGSSSTNLRLKMSPSSRRFAAHRSIRHVRSVRMLNRIREFCEPLKTEQHWQQDHYYFILDVELLLNQKFLLLVCNLVIPDTAGIIIFIPQCVLSWLKEQYLTSCAWNRCDIRITQLFRFITEQTEMSGEQLMFTPQRSVDAEECCDFRKSILNAASIVRDNVKNVVLVTDDAETIKAAMDMKIPVTVHNKLITHLSQE